MIREATGADGDFILEKARAAPGIGPRLEVDLRLLAENPKVPYKFYRVGSDALFEQAGTGGTLLGLPDDPAEFGHFLAHIGVNELMSDGYRPDGWPTERHYAMAWHPGPARPEAPAAKPAMPPPLCLDEHPVPSALMPLLVDAFYLPADDRDHFYAGLCLRLNHGLADAMAIRAGPGGEPLACALALSLTETHCHIAGVATLPQHQGRGLASALVAALCRKYRGRHVGLLCLPNLVPFYRRLGFSAQDATVLEATRPDTA